MCGIAGIFSLSGRPVAAEDVARMNAAIAHRGPDGEGLWRSSDGRCVLGHRRLAIIDVEERANQPMLSGDGRYAIVFNGEIYNFLEVRADLETKGHIFRTESDTEVILAAWREWGAAMQIRFNGMWAIAIYDTVEKSIFFSRDRFAEKPLYFAEADGYFAFASEVRALRALRWINASLDPDALVRATFDTHMIEGSDRTLYRQIGRLQAGHDMVIAANKRRVSRWWNTLDHLVAPPRTLMEAAEGFHGHFQEAVRIRMRSDVPIGSCLSGGFDSSAVVAMMRQIAESDGLGHDREARDWRHAFVASFPGMQNDETAEATIAARYAGIDSPNLIDMTVDGPLDHLEATLDGLEGLAVSVPAAVWSIYRAVRRDGVQVSIDGHGADEMIGGYRQSGQSLRFMLRNLLGNSSGRSSGFNWFSDQLKLRLLDRRGMMFLRDRGLPARFDVAAQNDKLPGDWGALNKRLYTMFHVTVLPTLMRNFDRLSMAHGVEVRSPFLDWRLACYAFSLPEAMKSDANYSKLVAREAMKGRMPEEIRASRIKKGFASQMPEWLNGGLGRWAEDIASSPNPIFESIIDQRKLLSLVQKLNAGSGWTWENSAVIWPYINAKWLCNREDEPLAAKLSVDPPAREMSN